MKRRLSESPTVNPAVAADNRAVSRSAFMVTLGGLFSLVAGLGNQVVVAWLFGAGADMDAYLTALVIPLYVEAAFLAGLPFVFIPAFVQQESGDGEEEAWALVGTVMRLASWLLVVMALVGCFLAPYIIALSAPELKEAKAELASRMLSIVMFSVPLHGLGTLTRGIENARNRFFWPAGASALSSVANLLVLVVLHPLVGAMALPWAYVMSELTRASVTLIPVLRHGWTKRLPLRDSRVREMLKLMLPFVLLGLVMRSTGIIERYFASSLPDGSLSYLGYASKFSQMVMAVVGSSIAAAIFPTMARAYSQEGETGLVERAQHGLRLSMAVSVPAVALLSALSVPLVTVALERGAFQATDTLSVSRIIPIVTFGAVVCSMVGNVLVRIFYVTKDTRTAPAINAVTSILYIFMAKVLTDNLGYVGLALAVPLNRSLAIVLLCVLLVRKMRSFVGKGLLKYTLQYAAASLLAFLTGWLIVAATASLPAMIQLLAGGILGGMVYLGVLTWMDREIARSVLELTGIMRLIRGARIGYRRILQAARG